MYGTLEHIRESSGGTLSKSQAASGVMSSFKPTDSAKLYASPDDLKQIGYRESGGDGVTSPNGAPPSSGGGGTLKKIRSSSLPPSKDGSNKGTDYAEPLGPHGTCNGGENIKRNNNSTGPNNQNGQFDPQRSLQEAKDKLRPVKPVLKSSSSLQNSNNSQDKIRIEVKQSPRLGRKPEKTVTFQNQADIPSPPESPANSMPHSMSVDEFQKIKTSLKVSKSFPNDLGGEDGNPAEPTTSIDAQGNYVTNLPVNPDSDSEDSSDKTWILKDENGPSSTSTTSDSVQTVISAASNALNKQQSTEEKISNLTHHEQMQQQQGNNKKPMSASAQLGITHNFEHLQQQHQQLYGRIGQTPVGADSNYGTISRSAGGNPGPRGGNANLTKNAVSLVKLPPPMEIESENEDGGRNTPTRGGAGTPVQKKTVVVVAGGGNNNVNAPTSAPSNQARMALVGLLDLQHISVSYPLFSVPDVSYPSTTKISIHVDRSTSTTSTSVSFTTTTNCGSSTTTTSTGWDAGTNETSGEKY